MHGTQRPSVQFSSVAQSCPTLCDPMDCNPPGSSVHGDSPGKNAEVGCHALLQGIFLAQGLNQGLLHCRQILYQLSHKGSTYPLTLAIVLTPASSVSPIHSFLYYAVLCLISQLCLIFVIPWTTSSPPVSSVHGDSSGKNIGVGCRALLLRESPDPEIKPISLDVPCIGRRVLYH